MRWSGDLIYVRLFVMVFGEVVSVLMYHEMLFPGVLNSIQYRGSSFRSRPLFPIQTGPNFCNRFIIYISGV